MKFKEDILKLSTNIIENVLIKSDALYKEKFYKNKIKKLNINNINDISSEERLIELNYILSSTNSRARTLFYINNINDIKITFLYSPDLRASGFSDYNKQTITVNLYEISSMLELQSTLIHELTHLKDWDYSSKLMNEYYDDGINYFTHPLEIKPWLMETWFYQQQYHKSFEETIGDLLRMYCDESQIAEIIDSYRFTIEMNEFYRNTFGCLLENQNCA